MHLGQALNAAVPSRGRLSNGTLEEVTVVSPLEQYPNQVYFQAAKEERAHIGCAHLRFTKLLAKST